MWVAFSILCRFYTLKLFEFEALLGRPPTLVSRPFDFDDRCKHSERHLLSLSNWGIILCYLLSCPVLFCQSYQDFII